MARSKSEKPNSSAANLGFEAKLWLAADKLRNNMDAAEYTAWAGGWATIDGERFGIVARREQGKIPAAVSDRASNAARRPKIRQKCSLSRRPSSKHVVPGLIFLKYISDTFEEHRAKLVAGKGDYAGANAEDPDEYKAENVFWVPKESRWSHLQASAKQPSIGKLVEDAMVAVERDNSPLKGVLPNLQESNSTTRRLAVMNLAIRGLEADFDPEHAINPHAGSTSPGRNN